MRNRYDNDFKVMISELLNSGRKVREISEEYDVEPISIRGRGREFKEKPGDFSKQRELTPEMLFGTLGLSLLQELHKSRLFECNSCSS